MNRILHTQTDFSMSLSYNLLTQIQLTDVTWHNLQWVSEYWAGCRFDFSMSFLQLCSGYWFLIHTGQTGCRYDFSISFLQLWSEYWTLYWIRLDARLWHSLKICSVTLKILSSMLVHTLVSLCPGWLLLCRPPNYWSEVTLRVDEGVWNFCYQFPPFRAV